MLFRCLLRCLWPVLFADASAVDAVATPRTKDSMSYSVVVCKLKLGRGPRGCPLTHPRLFLSYLLLFLCSCRRRHGATRILPFSRCFSCSCCRRRGATRSLRFLRRGASHSRSFERAYRCLPGRSKSGEPSFVLETAPISSWPFTFR